MSTLIFLTTGLSHSCGGPFYSVSGLAKAVAAVLPSPSVVVGCVADQRSWSEDRLEWGDLTIEEANASSPWAWLQMSRAVASHAHAATAERPAILHVSGLWDLGSRVALSTLSVPNVRRIISIRGMLEPWALQRSRLKKLAALTLWQKRVLSAADLIHATSELEYQSIRKFGLATPVVIIPNGLAEVGKVLECDARAQAKTPRRCIFLSRLHPKKGLDTLIKAWAQVAPRGWELHIAGEAQDGYRNHLESLARELTHVQIVFHGDLRGSAKQEYFQSGSLFVLPSYSENFGIAVAEALAAGLPVIATRGTPWAVLLDLGAGWWVEPSINAIADAITRATALSREQLLAMGCRGRAYAVKEFAWPQIAARFIDCYRWLTEGGRPPVDLRC